MTSALEQRFRHPSRSSGMAGGEFEGCSSYYLSRGRIKVAKFH